MEEYKWEKRAFFDMTDKTKKHIPEKGKEGVMGNRVANNLKVFVHAAQKYPLWNIH